MKLRFLAAAGPADARRTLATKLAQRRPQDLLEGPALASLSLWVEAGTPLLRNRAGTSVAVGLLFDRSAIRRLTELPDQDRLEESLTRRAWGQYVLFCDCGRSHWVVRDPSGAIPVYFAAAGGLHLYASDADMLRLAWPGPFRPDLDAVRHWLRFPFLRTARTGAIGVTELLPGMAREAGSGDERLRAAWSPRPFLAPDCGILSFDEAVARVRDAVLRSVRQLAEGQPGIVLQLSGGLDSSILAAALSLAGIRFRAITFATRSADGDERRHAHRVARRFGVDLEEYCERDLDLSVRTASGPLQRPPSPFLQALRSAQIAGTGPDALLVDGGGGDNLFCSINSAAPAIDAFRLCGAAACIRTLRELAARHGCTVWAVAASAARRALRSEPMPWVEDDSFLAAPLPSSPDPHPWLQPFPRMLPGSADHLRMIAGIHHFLPDPADGQPRCLHPLVNQPIVETCLRVRSWLWFEGGRDRAVARAAFRGILPDSILNRRGKGSLQSLFTTGFAASRAGLRGQLLSGRLAEEGIVDAAAIAGCLDRAGGPLDLDMVRLLEMASAEQWLRSFG